MNQISLFEKKIKKTKKIPPFTFVDLFSGIGGFRIALNSLGGKAIGFSEVFQPAIDTYKMNFHTEKEIELGDITSLTSIPYGDIYTGGVPCQSWSVAGKKKGFDDPRGKLWFDTIRLTAIGKPKVFIYENVKGLADPRNRESLNLIIQELSKIGYDVNWKVLNAFDFGLPQNRERIFIVGFRKDLNVNSFEFPKKYPTLPNLSSALDGNIVKMVEKLNPVDDMNSFNLSYIHNAGKFYTFCDTRNGSSTIHSWDLTDTTSEEKEICMAILKNRRKSKYGERDGNPLSINDLKDIIGNIYQSELDSLVTKRILRQIEDKYDFVNSKNSAGINDIYRVFFPNSHVFSTLTRTGSKDYIATIPIPENIKNKKIFFINQIYKKKKFRPITVKEALRIQGFPQTYKFSVPDRTVMQLLGNAVAVNIVKEVTKSIFNHL
ncbi:MAG: DNA cytosine methyltransferase [bacterium]